MIACVSPADINFEESLNTLRSVGEVGAQCASKVRGEGRSPSAIYGTS